MSTTNIIIIVVIAVLIIAYVLLKRSRSQNLPAVSEDVNLPTTTPPTEEVKPELPADDEEMPPMQN